VFWNRYARGKKRPVRVKSWASNAHIIKSFRI
jgi:hypothetical protein